MSIKLVLCFADISSQELLFESGSNIADWWQHFTNVDDNDSSVENEMEKE